MVAAGAEAEVRRAHAAGASVTARKALGFEELLAGDVEAMKRRTRNYARRQLTWMRKLAGTDLIDVTGRATAEVAARPWRCGCRGRASPGAAADGAGSQPPAPSSDGRWSSLPAPPPRSHTLPPRGLREVARAR